MSASANNTSSGSSKSQNADDAPAPEAFKTPGLTSNGLEIPLLARSALRRFAILSYKRENPCFWVAFIGGTGTGKSTLFNAFCGKPLSATGVERPKTAGPVAYSHMHCLRDQAFPFSEIKLEPTVSEEIGVPCTGKPGRLTIIDSGEQIASHLVLVDTPDLDSVEEQNHRIAKDLYDLSDAVVFVASQEKYADEVLHNFFMKVLKDRKPCFFILNKASLETTREEVLKALQGRGLNIHGSRLWLIPHTSPGIYDKIAETRAFIRLKDSFFQTFSKEQAQNQRAIAHTRATKMLKKDLARVGELLTQEIHATDAWLRQLEEITHQASLEYLHNQKERFSKTSSQYLSAEIRKLFSRYDLLAKPRRFVREIMKTPLRMAGLTQKKNSADRRAGLLKVQENVAFAPIQETLAKYNRTVLLKLSPAEETSPLFKALRDPDHALTEEETRRYILEAQEDLAQWLEETFESLAKGIPKHKKLGIHSTSILWGILIVTFNVVVGGGFTMLDAALDSALGPFVTKGAVEVFAYHEIRKIAKELAKRYQEGLQSILHRQEDRYIACLNNLMTPDETMTAMKTLSKAL
jgi:GTPase SAR1 family protein